jgi:hypothetical protein
MPRDVSDAPEEVAEEGSVPHYTVYVFEPQLLNA